MKIIEWSYNQLEDEIDIVVEYNGIRYDGSLENYGYK